MQNAPNKLRLFSMEKQLARPKSQPCAQLKFVILGLSITSSWGNGHAITYRGLVTELVRRGHHVLFLERDVPWYAENRDLARMRHGRVELYSSLDELKRRFAGEIRAADCVIVGSYVPEGVALGKWVTATAEGVSAFYDIDTPVTLANLERDECDYLNRSLIRKYSVYLSFTGGPTLKRLETGYGSAMARVLYCSIDPAAYYPGKEINRWDLGYLGTYSADRQPVLDRLLLGPARKWPAGRFAVAGPQYPDAIQWARNVERIEHLAPADHRSFYNSQRFTLNITRADMIRAGFSPSIRLFEAAACAAPIVSDYWDGLETVFDLGKEVLVAQNEDDVLRYVRDIPEARRHEIGWNARKRVLREHTSAHRAEALERYIFEARGKTILNGKFAS
jgi:spore maturation protein CgeB